MNMRKTVLLAGLAALVFIPGVPGLVDAQPRWVLVNGIPQTRFSFPPSTTTRARSSRTGAIGWTTTQESGATRAIRAPWGVSATGATNRRVPAAPVSRSAGCSTAPSRGVGVASRGHGIESRLCYGRSRAGVSKPTCICFNNSPGGGRRNISAALTLLERLFEQPIVGRGDHRADLPRGQPARGRSRAARHAAGDHGRLAEPRVRIRAVHRDLRGAATVKDSAFVRRGDLDADLR